jgi:hypothetical protein
MRYFVCAKGTAFQNIIVGKLKWLDMDDHVELFTMSFLNVNDQINPYLVVVFISLDVCCIYNFQG